MLYAAVVCPYLARPTARRGQSVHAAGLAAPKGTSRGLGGAVVGFEQVEYRYQDGMLFRFVGVCEFRQHELGDEQLDALIAAAVAAAPPGPVAVAPDYLMTDEDAADRRFAACVRGAI